MEKDNAIWDKISADVKEGFDIEFVYNFFLKTKKKVLWWWSYRCHKKEIHKVDSYHTCLVVTDLNSAVNKDRNYYPQVFLKEFKYIENETKVIRNIYDNLADEE